MEISTANCLEVEEDCRDRDPFPMSCPSTTLGFSNPYRLRTRSTNYLLMGTTKGCSAGKIASIFRFSVLKSGETGWGQDGRREPRESERDLFLAVDVKQ